MRIRDLLRLDDDHPFTGRHMLLVVLLFFGTIIAVNIAMVVAATGTFPGLVVKNSYVASQHYNELLESARIQNEAGWQVELAAPDGVITFRLADREGVARQRLRVTALAGRPSSTLEDRVIDLVEGPGGYVAAEGLPAGLWDVDIEAKRGDELIFREQRRLHVKRTDR
jgi:nitrogen fixation protein FixH